jgi:hypothetical protein
LTGALHLTCEQDEKLPLLGRIAALGDKVADLDVLPPSLEDIYSAISAGGPAMNRILSTAATEFRIALPQPLGRHRHRDDGAVLAGAVGGRRGPHRRCRRRPAVGHVASLTSLSVYLCRCWRC